MNSPVALATIDLPSAYYLAPVGALVALVFALIFYRGFMRQSEGDEAMVRVAQAVREGAYAYLGKQRNVVAVVFVGLIAVLLILAFGLGLQAKLTPLGVALAGTFSGLCGYLGMKTATNASARTAEACKKSLNDGLRIAFRAGAVMGLCVVGVGLLDVAVWFFVFSQFFEGYTLVEITTLMLSFALGVSLQALFARVGGGIYTKAADVGADLVGKVEAGIPEDDPRNPATIADNVGDNVGDVAGMGTDLYESYYTSIIAAMALAASAAVQLGLDAQQAITLVVAPPAIAGIGIFCSIVSIYFVRVKENATFAQLLTSLHAGVWLSSALVAVGSGGLVYWMLGDVEAVSWLGLWGAILVGLVAGLVIAFGTEIYTSYEHRPTQRIAEQSETGAATVIIAGLAEGMFSTWVPLLTIVFAIIASFTLAGGSDVFLMGIFGVGVAAVGMLSTLGITLATDAYGPIADNAGGNAEMTAQPPHVRERTDILDSLGNTTAATGKGFAIGSAALTALALLAAYATSVQSNLTRLADVPAAVVAAADSSAPAAYYQGYGIFGLLEEGKEPQTGLTLSDSRNIARLDDSLLQLPETSRLVKGSWSGDKSIYHATITDDTGTLEFEVVRATQATLPQVMTFYDVTLMNPRVLCGLFLGAMLIFLFCSMTMNAVGRAAYSMMTECRRQFALMKQGFRKDGVSEADLADPQKWPHSTVVDGKTYPDYANCVTISTSGALREMVIPSVMAVIMPLVVGMLLGVPAVMGLLAGSLVVGLAMAIFMANAGGAWDNAKKYIESGKLGGKGSDNHKATVVGDTVGDPFKDTSGPALNTLIKLVSIVSVVFSGFIVKYSPVVVSALGLN